MSWTREERHQLYRDAIGHWGEVAQVDMLVEELSECILATQKYFKRGESLERLDNLASEFADVLLMTEEIALLLEDTIPFVSFTALVHEQVQFKLDRTRQRLIDSKLQRTVRQIEAEIPF